jgi:glycosyltransferase involved in cell wall biosynthesis
MSDRPRVVAVVPCLDEEASVGAVIRDLMTAVPDIEVYVYDNGSTDRTVEVAIAAGAHVRHERRRGKGYVVQRAFADLDGDVFVLVDGDDTYDVAAVPAMVDAIFSGPLDHVVGVRSGAAYRTGHETGNKMFNRLVSALFDTEVHDMLTGLRVMSRRFVKSFPVRSRGFEVETELTVHAVGLRVPQVEVEVGFRERPHGSESKLNTFRDGARILRLILKLTRYERPLPYHGFVAAVLFVVGLSLGTPVVLEFLDTGLVRRFPTAILASSIMVIGFLAVLMGIVLEALRRVRDESARLSYLSQSAPERRGVAA